MIKPVTIPLQILALKNAKLPEKLLLSMYAADPVTTRVLRALSMTRAGLRRLEQRLIDKGLLSEAGARHVVHVLGLFASTTRMRATLCRILRPRKLRKK